MFSRRRNPPARPIDAGTQAAATIAASSVFQNNNRSNSLLSSAAAAAALRSHTSSPEPVGYLQTKRMSRRGSTSSNGSGSVIAGGTGKPGLVRVNSNGSMSERTFRSASPATKNGSLGSPSGRPASSLGNGTRLTSPPPTYGKRSSSADGALNIPASSARQSKRLSNVAEVEDDDQAVAHANFAKNFSTRDGPVRGAASPPPPSPPASPTAKKYTHGMGNWSRQGSADASTTRRPQSTDGRTFSMPSSLRSSGFGGNRPVSTTGRSNGSDRNSTPQRIYDPNSRSFIYVPAGSLAEPASPTKSNSTKVETVYDPNSRTFVPKAQPVGNEPAPPRSVPAPVTIGPVLAPKKQRQAPSATQTLEPPPRNPARLSNDEAAAESSRADTGLRKQPSVVREDPEAEEVAAATVEPSAPAAGSKRDSTILPAKTYVSPTIQPRRSASLDVPSLGMEPFGRGRVASHSPQRTARFSPSPTLRPQIHEPPPRDVSPAKSAMKQSPASSVRAVSPITTFSSVGFAGPASETSETPSLDQDGSAKRKKTVRVSFNEHSEEIVPAAVVASTIVAARSGDDMDDNMGMQPRAALPSFASVRRDRAEKVTETPPARHGPSSDHAIAGILRETKDPLPPEVTSKESAGYISDESSEADATAAHSANVVIAKIDATPVVAASNVRDFATAAVVPVPVDDMDVPAIALLPPTPRLDDDSKRDLSPDESTTYQNRKSVEIIVPGGWDKDSNETPAIVEATQPTPEIFDGGRNLSTEDSTATMTVQPIQLTASPLQLSDIDEDSDDAEFSDAFEDPSDFEDDAPGGFASLDAIVESPMVPPISTTVAKVEERKTPESPSVQQSSKRDVAVPDAEETPPSPAAADWGQATTYWSKLTREKRAQIEREHLSSDEELIVPTKKLRPKSTQASEPRSAPVSILKNKQQPAQSALKKSMRAREGAVAVEQSDAIPPMRKSMRDGASTRTSLRPTASLRSTSSNEGSVVMQKSMRPVSAGAWSSSSTGAGTLRQPNRNSQDSSFSTMRNKNTAPQGRKQMPQVSARLQKELARAEDSDSESSFKKRRRNRAADDRYTMKTSMRGASLDYPEPSSPIEQQRPVSPTPRTKSSLGSRLRSLSPISRNKSPPASPSLESSALRGSMRDNSAARTTMRQQPPSKAPTSRQTPAPSAAVTSRFRSRFVDSDEEDRGPAPNRSSFKSRFADSDDDEPASPGIVPANLTPVRGIPRRKGQEDGDSTDLEDEGEGHSKRKPKSSFLDESEIDKVMELARRNVGLAGLGSEPAGSPAVREGEALQKGSLRGKPVREAAEEDHTPPATAANNKPADINFSPPVERKKKGFMGSVLRRNRSSTASVPGVRSSSPPPPLPTSAPATASPAVATTNERPTSPVPSTPTRPPMGKLRKSSNSVRQARATSSPIAASPPQIPKIPDAELDSWGRPSSPIQAASVRPTTSDGLSPDAPTTRPDLAPRSQSHTLSAMGASSAGRRVQIMAGEEGSEPGEREPKNAVYSKTTGKKKKFGGLRRMFGLND